MRRSQLALLMVLILFVMPVLNAQQLSSQAATVLSNCSAAMGSSATAQIADSVMQATVKNSATPDAASKTVTIKAKGTNELRWESEVNGSPSVIIESNGVQKQSTPKGWRRMASDNSIHVRMLHLPALLIGQELTRTDLAATYVDEEALNGRSVYHVTLTRVFNFQNGNDAKLTKDSQVDVFIDAQTNLIAKISYIHLSEVDWRIGFPVEIYYDNYQTVQGMLVPFHQRIIYNKGNTSDMVVTSVTFNNGLADTIFQGGN
jgi:hypothetical protein